MKATICKINSKSSYHETQSKYEKHLNQNQNNKVCTKFLKNDKTLKMKKTE